MNRRTVILLLVPAILFAAYSLTRSVLATEESECDMKNVVKGHYCEPCDTCLEKKDLVSDAAYHECPNCGAISKPAGKCSHCEEALEKKTSGKNACPKCYMPPESAELCMKTCYECPDCGERKPAIGTCADCEESLVKVTVRSLIQYFCPVDECTEMSLVPGKCPNEDCAHQGKALVRNCTESGEFPHRTEGPGPEKR